MPAITYKLPVMILINSTEFLTLTDNYAVTVGKRAETNGWAASQKRHSLGPRHSPPENDERSQLITPEFDQ